MPSYITGTVKGSLGAVSQFTVTGRICSTYGHTQSTYTVDTITASSGVLPALGNRRTYPGTAAAPAKTEITGRPSSVVTGTRIEVEHVRPIPQQPGSVEHYVIKIR